jgi:hypothetical protein
MSTSLTIYTQHYQQGVQARQSGLDYTANPCQRRENALAWYCGWLSAQTNREPLIGAVIEHDGAEQGVVELLDGRARVVCWTNTGERGPLPDSFRVVCDDALRPHIQRAAERWWDVRFPPSAPVAQDGRIANDLLLCVGRALDGAVAERVLGWVWHNAGVSNFLLPPDFIVVPPVSPGRVSGYSTVYDGLLHWMIPPVPLFSNDRVLWLEIQANMHQRGYWLQLNSPLTSDPQSHWWAAFYLHGEAAPTVHRPLECEGDTLAEAVCRAALARLLNAED